MSDFYIVPCPKCQAIAGDCCKRPNGLASTVVHRARCTAALLAIEEVRK